MEPAAVYQDIENKERKDSNKRLVVILLARPQNRYAKPIMLDFDYMHFNTGKLCNVYAVGFSQSGNTPLSVLHYRKMIEVNGATWYYSDKAFYELKQYLEYMLDWEYSGEISALVLQNAPGEENLLDFHNSVSIDLEHAISRGSSFYRFMEELMHNVREALAGEKEMLDNNQRNYNVETITKDAFMRSLPIDSIEKESLYSQCVHRVEPRWR